MKSRFITTLALVALLFAGLTGTLSAKVHSYEIRQEGIAAVKDVVIGSCADLVLLESGMEKNFCTGAVCIIERNGVPVAEVIIAESTEINSVALVTRYFETNQILAGDSVKLKTITF